MKNIRYFFLFSLLVAVCSSCQKEETMLYQNRAGVYFSTSTYTYTFAENPGLDTAIVRLPVTITGLCADYDREFKATLPDVDTLTTAEDDQYKIGRGFVKAGESTGFVELEIYRDERLKDSTYNLYLSIQKTPDFPEIRLNRYNMKVSFTDRFIQPDNWSYLGLGTFSTAWWSFILEVTDGNPLRYWGGINPDPEYWTMGAAELAAWKSVIRRALDEYNDGPNGPLIHDDGPSKGQEVEMPLQ